MKVRRRHPSGRLLIVLAALGATSAAAQENSAPPLDAPSSPGNQAADPGGDFLSVRNLFQLMYSDRSAPGNGLVKGTLTEVTTETAKLRADYHVDLAPQWELVLRGDLPFLARNPVNANNPNGDFLYGVGDADIQAAVIDQLNERWKAGFGARLIAPTGAEAITSGKWRIMPGAAVRYDLQEISAGSYFEPLLRYEVSFAGDPSKRNISNLQFAPTFNIGLPNRWFFTLFPSPDIRVNFGDPIAGQTGRLFVPLDARIGRKISDNVTLSLEAAAPIIRDYPVFDFKTEVRLNIRF
jgi:hypothetical protein